MKTKVKIVIVLCIVIGIGYFAFQKFGPVKAFPSNEQLADRLKIETTDLKDVIQVSEYYYYVPYVKNDRLHMSFWKFHKRHWEVLSDHDSHEILLWTFKDGERYIVWHIEGEQMDTLNLFATFDRNYHISSNEKSETIQRYYPQIALKHAQSIDENVSYGIFKVPEDWQTALQRTPIQDTFSFFNDYMEQPSFQWHVVDASGEVVQTKTSGSSSSTTNFRDSSNIDFVFYFQPFLEEEQNVE